MPNDKREIRCSFCGRTQDEVKRIIAGPGAYICNECVEICADLIADEAEQERAEARFELGDKLPTPAEIKKSLDEYDIGQDRAKIALSVAVYNHYKRIMHTDKSDRSHVVL